MHICTSPNIHRVQCQLASRRRQKGPSPEVAQKAIGNQWDYFTSVNNGVFCELGKGDVDFKALVNYLLINDYRGWIVVEQDVLPGMGDPKKCAQNNRKYLQSIGL